MKTCLCLFTVILILSFAGCSSSSSSSLPPTTYTIGGSASGLAGAGLVLQDNGADNLSVAANGNFTFKTAVTSGGAYKVTVQTQPSNPTQNCLVANGGGKASANVTNVQVTCTTDYTIGGSVSGLIGTGLTLLDNGGDNLSVSANGGFTFATLVASGGPYAVTVQTQPSSPAQTCLVTNSSGNASANVTTVQVVCTTNPVATTWIWMGGANVVNQAGTYGTQGTPSPANIPSARDSSATWTDHSGNFWLFGGCGIANGSNGCLNDLWEYSSSEWTWIGGSTASGQAGVYGTLGVASPSNFPGSRSEAVSWIDASGNVWIFGGCELGCDGTGTHSDLNDLWEYSSGQWTWVNGSNTANQSGTYGTQGAAAPTNVPGARHHAVSWIDGSGNLWLFGGLGYDSTGNYSPLNDLWEYSSGQWTWMSGSSTADAPGVYGTLGVGAPANVPGARSAGAAWKDSVGNFWLFGGGGYDSNGVSVGFLNDTWKYSAGEWTWMGGSNVNGQIGTYGTEGTAAAGNIPGGRIQPTSWADASGNFWFLGGYGLDSAGTQGELSDLWMYSAGEWTWVSGSNVVNQIGTYGTLGLPASTNVPGARQATAVWVDTAGNFWVFGGFGNDSQGTSGELNDLWVYQP